MTAAGAPRVLAAVVAVAVALGLPATAGAATGDLSPGRWFRFADPAITESSGLAASRVNEDILWTHNDSGDDALVYAVDPASGATRAVLSLDVDARDWEDLAAGPGPPGEPSLYVGDIGDNNAGRESIVVRVVPEPDLSSVEPGATVEATATTSYRFVYEDGPHDAETLLVDPDTGRIAVATKDLSGRSDVYLAPETPDPDGINPLTLVATARFTIPADASDTQGPIGRLGYYLATGGDISPDGTRVVLRSYGEAREWLIPDGDLAAAFAADPAVTPLPDAPQGEAITYTADGSWLVASSEGEDAIVDLARPAELVAPTTEPTLPTEPDPEPPTPEVTPSAPAPPSDPTRALATVALAAAAILALGTIAVRATASRGR